MPRAQVQQATILLAPGCGENLLGHVLIYVSKTLFQVSFLCYSALLWKADNLHLHVALCELLCDVLLKTLVFCLLFLTGNNWYLALGQICCRLFVSQCQIFILALFLQRFLVSLEISNGLHAPYAVFLDLFLLLPGSPDIWSLLNVDLTFHSLRLILLLISHLFILDVCLCILERSYPHWLTALRFVSST